MELLKQLIESEKLTIPDLDAEVRDLGFNPETLTTEETNLIFEQLSTKYKSSKPSKKSAGAIAKHNAISPVEALKTDLGKGLREVNAELDQMTLTIQEVVDTVVETKAQSMFSLVKSIPQLTSGRVKELIEASNGDMTFFRQSSSDLKESLLSEFGIK